MKKNISRNITGIAGGFVLCLMLFAFSERPGAHSVQVYLDSKMVIDQYLNSKAEAPRLTLEAAEHHQQLIVKYSECGRTVTGRKLTIRDNENRVLKEWKFDGPSAGFQESMSCPVKDILALKQKKHGALKLYYSSNDFPEGQQVAYLVVGGQPTASN